MKRTAIFYYRVQVSGGPGAFPIDMLRYDGLVPETESDSAEITRSHLPGEVPGDSGRKAWVVSLLKLATERAFTPNADRWRSFGWTVDFVEPWNGRA